MLIYYWSPYLTNIATINAVTNSIIALEKFSKKDLRYKISIINACGEWSNLKDIEEDIQTINLLPFNLHKFLPKEGFIQSRISMIIIAIVSFLPMLVKVRKNIYARSVKGLFSSWRIIFIFLTQILYYGLPWINWNGRQAVLFDLILCQNIHSEEKCCVLRVV
jgi:hypothetical protein